VSVSVALSDTSMKSFTRDLSADQLTDKSDDDDDDITTEPVAK